MAAPPPQPFKASTGEQSAMEVVDHAFAIDTAKCSRAGCNEKIEKGQIAKEVVDDEYAIDIGKSSIVARKRYKKKIQKGKSKPWTRGDAKSYKEFCLKEEQKNKSSYSRVMRTFFTGCRSYFLHVPGARFHTNDLIRDIYQGVSYHAQFSVSLKDGSTTFMMAQVVTVMLNLESLDEALSIAGRTLNEEIYEYLQNDFMYALPLPESELETYGTEDYSKYRNYEAYVRVDFDSPTILYKHDLKEMSSKQ